MAVEQKLSLRVYGPAMATREDLEAQLQMLHRITAVLVERLGGKVIVAAEDADEVLGGKLTVEDASTGFERGGIAISYRRRS